jgi:hypothetical protein
MSSRCSKLFTALATLSSRDNQPRSFPEWAGVFLHEKDNYIYGVLPRMIIRTRLLFCPAKRRVEILSFGGHRFFNLLERSVSASAFAMDRTLLSLKFSSQPFNSSRQITNEVAQIGTQIPSHGFMIAFGLVQELMRGVLVFLDIDDILSHEVNTSVKRSHEILSEILKVFR